MGPDTLAGGRGACYLDQCSGSEGACQHRSAHWPSASQGSCVQALLCALRGAAFWFLHRWGLQRGSRRHPPGRLTRDFSTAGTDRHRIDWCDSAFPRRDPAPCRVRVRGAFGRQACELSVRREIVRACSQSCLRSSAWVVRSASCAAGLSRLSQVWSALAGLCSWRLPDGVSEAGQATCSPSTRMRFAGPLQELDCSSPMPG